MKEPPPSCRRRPLNGKKIKLVCSFNGGFHPRPPSGNLRYIGGEARIISVDRNVSFSKLRSKISDLCPNTRSFSLKYQIPASDSVKDDSDLLVLISSDDDVRCMIDEFDRLELYGKPSRLWIFVCCDNAGNENRSLYSTCVETFGKDGADCESVCGGNGKFVPKQNFSPGMGREIDMEMECLGKQKYDHPLIDLAPDPKSKVGMNAVNRIYQDQCGVDALDNKLAITHLSGNENLPNFPSSRALNLRNGNLRAETNSMRRLLGSSGINVSFCGAGVNVQTLNQSAASINCLKKQSNCSCGISLRNVWDVKRHVRNIERPTMSNMNRENIVPRAANCSSVRDSFRWSTCSDQSSILYNRSSENDAEDQKVYPFHTQSHQNNLTKMGNFRVDQSDGRLLTGKSGVGLKPNLNISKQGRSMRVHCPYLRKLNSGVPEHASPGRTRRRECSLNTDNSLFGKPYSPTVLQNRSSDFAAHHGECIDLVQQSRPTGLQTVETQEDLLTGSDSDAFKSRSQNLFSNFQGVPLTYNEPISWDYKEEQFLKNPQEDVSNQICSNSMFLDTSVSNYTYGASPSSVDVSSYNLPLSPRAEPHVPSYHATVDSFENSNIVGHLVNGVDVDASNPSQPNAASSVFLEEIQQDSPPNQKIDKKAEATESEKCSKVIGGISNDLTTFYTHLATRELQTIKTDDLEYIKELGSGTYGTVFFGKWKGSGVAVKKIKPSCFTGASLEEDRLIADFWKEAHILGQLNHPNIVAFYGVVTDGPVTNLATVTEYMVNGSLKQVLRRKDRTIDRRKRLIIAMDAAFGMEYLHEKNIVHFDLKSHNFLVNMRDPQRPICKIGDLGLSKIKQRTLVSGGVRGTIPWMAPELLNSEKNMVTEKVDVYSFGVVMWELLTGEEPYANLQSEEILAGIIKGTLRPEIPRWCDPAWRSLMERCWSSDSSSRPAFSEIAKELRAMSSAANVK